MVKTQSASVFGIRLREARKRSGLPQDRLGVAIGLDEGTASARISRYESGVHEPAHATAKMLAGVLGVPAAFFYAESDELAYVVRVWGEMSNDERMRLGQFLEAVERSR
jgi:transcriptional regulator with XRE-family HTH domain